MALSEVEVREVEIVCRNRSATDIFLPGTGAEAVRGSTSRDDIFCDARLGSDVALRAGEGSDLGGGEKPAGSWNVFASGGWAGGAGERERRRSGRGPWACLLSMRCIH